MTDIQRVYIVQHFGMVAGSLRGMIPQVATVAARTNYYNQIKTSVIANYPISRIVIDSPIGRAMSSECTRDNAYGLVSQATSDLFDALMAVTDAFVAYCNNRGIIVDVYGGLMFAASGTTYSASPIGDIATNFPDLLEFYGDKGYAGFGIDYSAAASTLPSVLTARAAAVSQPMRIYIEGIPFGHAAAAGAPLGQDGYGYDYYYVTDGVTLDTDFYDGGAADEFHIISTFHAGTEFDEAEVPLMGGRGWVLGYPITITGTTYTPTKADFRVMLNRGWNWMCVSVAQLEWLNEIEIEESVTPALSTTSTTPHVIAFTAGKVWAGRLHGTMTQVGTTGLFGTDVESIVLANSAGSTRVWAVDGTDSFQIDVLGNTVAAWTSSVGTFPDPCALVAVYQGRAVLARTRANRNLYHMSRVNDPRDWDYSATDTDRAFVGTNSAIGRPADAIVALMTGPEDYMFFGCQRSIWSMVGDPGYGGRVQVLSNGVGVLGPRAWCYDDEGTIWFVGSSGLYKIVGVNPPVNVSGVRLKTLLDRIDTTATLIQLGWDAFRREVHVYLTPKDEATVGTHVVYDAGSDAFWLDQYPLDFGPTGVAPCAGDSDADRRVFIGGLDGYIRQESDDATDDDGSEIESYVDFAPVEIQGGSAMSMAASLQLFGAEDTGAITWEWYTGRSPDQVRQLVSSPDVTGTAFADGSVEERVGLRRRAPAHKLRLSQTSADEGWRFERAVVQLLPGGVRR